MSTSGGRSPKGLVAATIDIGSNSVHLLVAVARGHRLEPLVDESAFLGLGEAVAARPELGPLLVGDLVTAIGDYAERARLLGATRICVVGTQPLRQATDAATVVRAVEREHHLALEVLEHDEEALLTLIGATAGRRLLREVLVVDVGGGSTEFVVVAPGGPPRASGIRAGSVQLTARHVRSDPPTPAELAEVLAEARQLVAGAPDARPADTILVGGTASNLLRVTPVTAPDRRLSRARIEAAMRALAAEPAELLAARHGIRPARAKTLAAGGAIVLAVMERYGLRSVRVSEAGIREGAILAVAHAGDEWRTQLREMARGWHR